MPERNPRKPETGVSTMLTNSHLWQQWSIKDWNKALLNHFFRDTDGEDRPIHRIPVTGDELRKIVGEPDADTNEVQEAFLSALRTPSHILFNRRLAQYPLDLQVGWGGGSIPPFVARFSIHLSCGFSAGW